MENNATHVPETYHAATLRLNARYPVPVASFSLTDKGRTLNVRIQRSEYFSDHCAMIFSSDALDGVSSNKVLWIDYTSILTQDYSDLLSRIHGVLVRSRNCHLPLAEQQLLKAMFEFQRRHAI